MNRLFHLPQSGCGLLVQDLVHNLFLTLRNQEQNSVQHHHGADIGQRKLVSNIMTILVLRRSRQMALMSLDPSGEMVLVKSLGLTLTELEVGSRERDPVKVNVQGLGRVCVLVHEMLFPGIGTEKVELAGEIALNGLSLGQLERRTIRGGLVEDL